MENSVCFLGSFGSNGRRVQYQSRTRISALRPCGKQFIFHSHPSERNRRVLCCLHENDQTEDQNPSLDPSLEEEFKNVARMSVQNSGDENQRADRQIMDGITETGVKEIEGIANEVKDELEDLQRLVEENADRLIEEETRQVLESYDQKQKELLRKVEKDRQAISTEIEQIKELAQNVERGSGMDRSKSLREKAYFIMCLIFSISAVYYAWSGFVDSDTTALTNAGIDAAVAAACTYFYSKEGAKK